LFDNKEAQWYARKASLEVAATLPDDTTSPHMVTVPVAVPKLMTCMPYQSDVINGTLEEYLVFVFI
jgi:hypothetical protein